MLCWPVSELDRSEVAAFHQIAANLCSNSTAVYPVWQKTVFASLRFSGTMMAFEAEVCGVVELCRKRDF